MVKEMISVIVPVYRVEQYLDKCIESIVHQTYQNLEIILVDDGSPDRCPQMCDLWKKKDNRIIVIHSDNMGAGYARNIGLKNAHGKYISFVDSDDFLKEDFIEYLYNLFDDETDIVECEYIHFVDEINFPNAKNETIKKFDMIEAMKLHIDDFMFKQVIWNKLYRRKVIESVFFPIDKKIDDEFWTYRVIAKSNKLIHSTRKGYGYRQHKQSVMHQLSDEKRLQGIEAKIERNIFIKNNLPSLENNNLVNLWFSCMYHCQLLLRGEMNIHDKKIIKEIQKIIEGNSITHIFKLQISYKDKIWLKLANLSFINVCKLRNFLNIGV